MRITPACAGKSRAWPGTTPCRRDHPRVCGEKSPADDELGITPACAGKSWVATENRTIHGDHPRVCGEKTKESLKK